MSRVHWRKAWSLLIITGLGGLLLAGCGKSEIHPAVRPLNRGEASQLIARQMASEKERKENQLPGDPKQLELQGDHLALGGDLMGAMVHYHRAVKLAKKDQQWRLKAKAATVCLRARDFAQAAEIFGQLTQERPQDALLQQGLGLAHLGRGETGLARTPLKNAVSLDPKLWKAHNALGVIFNRLRQPEKALAALDKAQALRPRRAEIENNRALAFLLAGRMDQAEASFKRALSLDSDLKLAHNNLAFLLARKGRLAESFSSFTKGSGPAQAHNNLGCLLSWQGDYDQAASHFRQALQAMPRYYPLAGDHLERVSLQAKPSPPRPVVLKDLQGSPQVDLKSGGERARPQAMRAPASYRFPAPAALPLINPPVVGQQPGPAPVSNPDQKARFQVPAPAVTPAPAPAPAAPKQPAPAPVAQAPAPSAAPAPVKTVAPALAKKVAAAQETPGPVIVLDPVTVAPRKTAVPAPVASAAPAAPATAPAAPAQVRVSQAMPTAPSMGREYQAAPQVGSGIWGGKISQPSAQVAAIQ